MLWGKPGAFFLAENNCFVKFYYLYSYNFFHFFEKTNLNIIFTPFSN